MCGWRALGRANSIVKMILYFRHNFDTFEPAHRGIMVVFHPKTTFNPHAAHLISGTELFTSHRTKQEDYRYTPTGSMDGTLP